MKFVFLAVALLGVGSASAQQMLTDGDVVRMVKAGVAKDIVLKMIAESPVAFGASPDHLIAWKEAGVPDEIARAMMARQREAGAIQYVHFSSEMRVIPAKRGRRWTHLKIW